MERMKQKTKKEKPNKCVEKDKSTFHGPDVKTLKENIKIKEILRTVKMNSSMRIKAPRGSRVMQNKDFNDSEDIFEDTISAEGQVIPTSATNTVLNDHIDSGIDFEGDCAYGENNSHAEVAKTHYNEEVEDDVDKSDICQSKSLSTGLNEISNIGDTSASHNAIAPTSPAESPLRSRKLSLDHKMLSRRKGLSQSEVDLHSVGKLPLERKSSFFRKKLDSFLKNTTEIFKRQPLGSKSTKSQRRGSKSSRISVSMQSLNENAAYVDESIDQYHEHGSVTSLRSTMTASNSSFSMNVSDRPPDQSEESLASSRHGLGSQPLDTSSIHCLNEDCKTDSLLNARAISMSSGLDTASGQRKRKTNKSNRVTWLASESLTDYFHRLIQNENSDQMQGCSSYQDFSTIPENIFSPPRCDSKGRRLSYMRAVSGEDPAQTGHHDSLRRKKISENESGPPSLPDIAIILNEFGRNGIPQLPGYTVRKISDDATAYLERFSTDNALEALKEFFSGIPGADQPHHSVVLELVHTEADHIRHLKVIADVYLAVAHALQERGLMTEVETCQLFLNIPDVLNSNMRFWEKTLYPMLRAAKEGKSAFNTSLMVPGFMEFHDIFEPYEVYVHNQTIAVDLLRELQASSDFVLYLTWCNQNSGHRLQLADILVKPMQRLTKYSLLINRLNGYISDESKKKELEMVDTYIRGFIQRVNRGVRQRDETAVLKDLQIERYEPDFKGDEEMAKRFRSFKDFKLQSPMIDCGHFVLRSLVHQGDLRFKDHQKEFDAHVLLFTDIFLICKKYTKANKTRLRMVRPRYLMSRTVPYIRPGKGTHDLPSLIYVVLDEYGVSREAFMLCETSKDANPALTMKTWEQKIQEAMMSYELTKWYYKYPVKDLSVVEGDYNTDEFKRSHAESVVVERRARERVAAMMHPNTRSSRDPSQEPEIPLTDFERARGPANLHEYCVPGSQNYTGFGNRRTSSFQQSTASHSSQISQYVSSTELHASLSGGSHEELPSISVQRSAGSSMDHGQPDDVPPSITVNVVGENDCETLVPSRLPTPPLLVLHTSSPNQSLGGNRSESVPGSYAGSENTLRVSPTHSGALRSLPDLSAELQPLPHAASAIMYQMHLEQMERNRQAAGHLYLSPYHRGSSYPPPSPTRGSLQRGLAFNHSFTLPNPRLTRSQNIETGTSQFQIDIPTFADALYQRFAKRSARAEPQPGTSNADHRSPSPSGRTTPTPSLKDTIALEVMPSTSKGSKSKSPVPEKPTEKIKKPSMLARSSPKHSAEKHDESDIECLVQDNIEDVKCEDDRSRRSSKSTKSTKSHSHKQNIPSKPDEKKEESSKINNKEKG